MGPLQGIRIVELSGIGPAPFCGMLLADMGADVIRIDRLSAADLGFNLDIRFDFLNRNKRAAAIDLKSPDGVAAVLDLVARADLLIEGFRPDVAERLGLGPAECQAVNPRLVYGRMTGWGQDGPMRNMAGHDINYISMTGALAAIGSKDGPPVTPLNLVGDFGGGGLYLAMGLLAALHEAGRSGRGQVVDAAMVDGVASLLTLQFGLRQAGLWENARGSNPIDGGAPYYTTYATRDGKYLAVGAIERRFYERLLAGLGLADDADLPGQHDRSRWNELRDRLAKVFASKTRDEWVAVFGDRDACVTPVLDMDECMHHPLARERQVFVECDGRPQPAPAPRFSRTAGTVRSAPQEPRAATAESLLAWGFSETRLADLKRKGVIPSQ